MLALSRETAAALRGCDTCSVSNAIETFDVRLRNEGFTDARIRCLFDDMPPIVGHAVTAKIKTAATPPTGTSYHDRTDWWTYIAGVPAPRIVVVEDIDNPPGVGSLVGDVHAAILQALECAGYVTNGAVRDLPAVGAMGFQMFAGSVSVSHAFAHLIEFGEPVEVAGLRVASGDILHGDRHGIVSIPPQIAADIPRVVADMHARERRVIDFCRSGEFSLQGLRALVKELG